MKKLFNQKCTGIMCFSNEIPTYELSSKAVLCRKKCTHHLLRNRPWLLSLPERIRNHSGYSGVHVESLHRSSAALKNAFMFVDTKKEEDFFDHEESIAYVENIDLFSAEGSTRSDFSDENVESYNWFGLIKIMNTNERKEYKKIKEVGHYIKEVQLCTENTQKMKLFICLSFYKYNFFFRSLDEKGLSPLGTSKLKAILFKYREKAILSKYRKKSLPKEKYYSYESESIESIESIESEQSIMMDKVDNMTYEAGDDKYSCYIDFEQEMEEEDDKYSVVNDFRLEMIKSNNSNLDNFSTFENMPEIIHTIDDRDDISTIQGSKFDTDSQISNSTDISLRIQNFVKNKTRVRGRYKTQYIQDDNYFDDNSLSFRIQDFIERKKSRSVDSRSSRSHSVKNRNIRSIHNERGSNYKEKLIQEICEWVEHTDDLSVTSLRCRLNQGDNFDFKINKDAMGVMNLMQYASRNSVKPHIMKYLARNKILIENDENSIFLSDILRNTQLPNIDEMNVVSRANNDLVLDSRDDIDVDDRRWA